MTLLNAKKRLFPCISVALVLVCACQRLVLAGPPEQLDAAVSSLHAVGWENAKKIWDWSEPGYKETKSSALLSDWLESSGFRVKRGICGIPTAFVAEYGSGSPVIALLGEYDALPGLSQDAVPYQQPRSETSWGQGCGHHLFGVASAMAAIGLAQQMEKEKLTGTIRFYGCPAEEGGSAKAFMVRDGAFDGVDVALHWHPGSSNSADAKSSLARVAVRFRFSGISAHAAGAPDQGRSALDGVEVTNFAANLMREHMPQQARMHYVITDGGKAPNVVPDKAEVYYYIRHPQSAVVRDLYKRLVNCAEAGALATGTKVEVLHEGGILELLTNTPLADQIGKNLKARLNLKWTDEDREFALRLQETMAAPKSLESIKTLSNAGSLLSMGSTDVGDVSWVVPTAGFSVATWVPGTPGHSWQAVACGKTDLARQAMGIAAQVLAATGRDLLTSPELVAAAKKDFENRLKDGKYIPLIEDGQSAPLEYRNSVIGKVNN